jgi:hypothetical protein
MLGRFDGALVKAIPPFKIAPVNTTPETSQQLLGEVAILLEVKSRLLTIPEAIDVTRDLRTLITGLQDLAGRIGKTCSRCGLRNHVLDDGKHECLSLKFSSGSSNLGEVKSG